MLERPTSIRFNDMCINAGFFETARMERREVEETLAAILEQDKLPGSAGWPQTKS